LLMIEELCTTPPCRTFGIHACQSNGSHSMRTGFVKPNLQVPMLPLTFCTFTCMSSHWHNSSSKTSIVLWKILNSFGLISN
jgi:hypothetical protein